MGLMPFRLVSGQAIALLLDDVNTDVIIRTLRLSTVERDALGPYAFESLRFTPDGRPDTNCVLNDPRLAGAPVLLAGSNFGSGSSREGAVWALQQRGLRCVIAVSFGEIFRQNCFQNGLLPVTLPRAAVECLAERARRAEPFTVDLQSSRIRAGADIELGFTVDPAKRLALLAGLDDVASTQQRAAAIARWQEEDRQRRPWIWSPAGRGTSVS